MTTTSRWLREQPRETRRWVIDLVLELYDDGQSYAAIARRLDADGIPRLSGGHWWAELVAHLVRCELGDTTPTPMALRRARRGSPPTRARGLAESPERCPPGSQASAAWWSAPGDPSEAPGDVVAFLEVVRATRAPATLALASLALRRLARFACVGPDDELSRALTPELLRRYAASIAVVAPDPGTRSGQLNAVRTFLHFAAAEGWHETDLASRIQLPRVLRRDPRPVPPEQVPAMLARLPGGDVRDLRDRALIYFLVSTGCRIAEALALDRPRGALSSEMRVRDVKRGRMRTVFLFAAARSAVDDYLASRADRSRALFATTRQPIGRLTPAGFRVSLHKLRARLPDEPGLAHVTGPHVFRHTAATLLGEVTHDARLVQEVLGHSSVETVRNYMQVTEQQTRRVYEAGSRFAQLLHGDAETGARP